MVIENDFSVITEKVIDKKESQSTSSQSKVQHTNRQVDAKML